MTSSQSVLVTGANSSLGQAVGRRLRVLGHQPIGTVRRPSTLNLEEIFDRVIHLDLGEFESLACLSGSFDAVIHVAALSYGTAQDLMRVTGLGSRALAERAVSLNIRKFIHVSSISVYGVIAVSPVSRFSSIQFASPYGVAKWAAECYLNDLSDHFEHVSVRCPAIVGDTVSPHFLARLYKKMSSQEPLIRLYNPEFRFNNVISESSLSEFLAHLATNETGCPPAIPVASTQPIALSTIVDKMSEATSYEGTISWESGTRASFSIDESEAVHFGLRETPTVDVIDQWLSRPVTVRDTSDKGCFLDD